MPEFELIPLNEAMLKSTTGKRAQIIAEYMGYIDQLEEGRAGKFQATEGETTAAIRRRMGAAAKLAGKEIVVKRVGDEVYVWAQEKPRRRPGRPRKSSAG